MIKEYNFDEFDRVSRSQWIAKLNQDLGEQLAAKISSWDCERDLPMKAYYDADDSPVNSMIANPVHSPWKYLEPVSADDSNESVLDALMNGADGIILAEDCTAHYVRLLAGVAPQHCTLALRSAQTNAYTELLEWCDSQLDASNEIDLLLVNDTKSITPALIDKSIPAELFKLGLLRGHKIINLNGNLIQEKGGGARLELAYLLSQAVHNINRLLDEGYTIENIVKCLFITTSVGANFFLEMAKIRVMRKLIGKVLDAYGLVNHNVPVHASTSRLTQSALDKNTNYLRCTTAAMSAVLGGADYMTITPYHDLSSRDRIARNISNLLKDESMLGKSIDPASGSYYLENLSDELAQRSWQLFQSMEKRGGFKWAIDDGFLEDEIKKDREFHMSRISSGKRKLVGVNDFGNQDEKLATHNFLFDDYSYSMEFEKVRKSVESYVEAKGEELRPAVYLYGVGSDAKMINARFTFATNFFTWSGIKVIKLKAAELPKQGAVVVCCGADSDYSRAHLANAMKLNTYIIAAGKDQPELSEIVSAWINVKSDRLESVKSVLEAMDVNLKMTEI